MMLREGQSKVMDGTVTMYPNEHPGHQIPRLKMQVIQGELPSFVRWFLAT